MKKKVLIITIIVIAILLLIIGFYVGVFDKITGKAISNEQHTIGPSAEEQSCMKKCVTDAGCTMWDMTCPEKDNCIAQCNLIKPEVTEETSCMEECVLVGCDQFDFACQGTNQEKCEKECNMIKEPEAKSEEEQCIRDCVNAIDPSLMCQPGEGGEKGDETCQRCAKQCEYLYEGPCLMEMELEEKKGACETCEHCYGEPVMGDSGEGYDCIVDVTCKDASSEFGDDPGSGPGIGQEGFVAQVGDALGNVVESIGNFFSDMFSGEEETTTETATNSE